MSTSSNPIESSATRRAFGRPTRAFKGHTQWVQSVAYFPDGRHIASGSYDGTVIIWDVESGREDGQPLRHNSLVMSMAISPDGRRIASGTEGGLVIWDALTREVVHEIKGGGVYGLAYSLNGRWIAAVPRVVGGMVRLWDATAPTAHESLIRLWDADTGRPSREPLKCDGRAHCVAFSPDGSQIAVGLVDGSFRVIDISTGECVVGPIKGHTDRVSSVVYSPDGHLLVTGSDDKSIRLWDSKTGVEVGKPMLGWEPYFRCVSITADGRRIASGGFGIQVWDLETRLQVGHSFNGKFPVYSAAFSPDDRYIIRTHGPDVFLYDTQSLTIQGSSSPHTASNRNPPAPRTQAIPPLNQQRQARTRPHNDTSSLNSSLLDLPAVAHEQPATQRPQERKPSVDDDWDTESIRQRLRPTEPQQDPPLVQDTQPTQPTKPDHKWSHNVRERWQRMRPRRSRVPADVPRDSSHPPDVQPTVPASPELPTDPQTQTTSTAQPSVPGRPWPRTVRERWERIRSRKSREPTDLPDSSPCPPLPLHERVNAPVSPELPANQQVRRERATGTQEDPLVSHSQTQSSRNQNEANVALGRLDERLYAAPPRDRAEQRRRRARERRRAARNRQLDSDSDSEPEDDDAESYYEDTGCLDAICFGEYFRRRRHLQGQ